MHGAATSAGNPTGWLEGAFTRIERVLIAVAGAAILVSGGITFTSVFGRWLFGWAVPDGEIIVQDMMIVACVLPLAVVIGAPCSGPLMAGAIGYAFAQPAAASRWPPARGPSRSSPLRCPLRAHHR